MEMVIRRVPGWDGTKESTELYHHGIKGQKWGVRRYQNPDSSLTSAGKARYRSSGKYGSFMDEYSSKAKAYGQAAKETASRYGAAAKETAISSAKAARTATNSDVITSRVQFATSNFDTSTRRASNLGETGTGVRSRSRLGSHSSLRVSDDLSSIKPEMKVKGKDFCDNLLDKDVQELREREMVQIGRFYTEGLYKGIGGTGISSMSGTARYYAKQGRSQTGGESGYYMTNPRRSGGVRDAMITRVEQDREAEIRRRSRSGENIKDVINDVEDKYDKIWEKVWDDWSDPKRKNLSKKW